MLLVPMVGVRADITVAEEVCLGADCPPQAEVPVAQEVTPSVPSVPATAATPAAPETPALPGTPITPPAPSTPSAPASSTPAPASQDDADLDFARGMMANQRQAVEMAKDVLAYGRDPDLRMLAGDVVKASGDELERLQKWLALHGPQQPARPKAPVMRVPGRGAAKPMSELLDEMEGKEPAAKTQAPVSASTALAASPTAPLTMPLLDDAHMREGSSEPKL
ncbi:MAG: DUF305 domain-containing protein [Proteobacteria bacterium]|nr:DUF305 domain-containing protein [Pseudomonadota bacterium]